MKTETIGVIILSLVLMVTGLVGPIPLSLAIVATYALMLKLMRSRKVDQKMANACAYLMVGIFGIPMLGLLVFLWGLSVGLSFSWSAAAWVGIIAAGTGWAQLVPSFSGFSAIIPGDAEPCDDTVREQPAAAV